jgi:hypothetical protein
LLINCTRQWIVMPLSLSLFYLQTFEQSGRVLVVPEGLTLIWKVMLGMLLPSSAPVLDGPPKCFCDICVTLTVF